MFIFLAVILNVLYMSVVDMWSKVYILSFYCPISVVATGYVLTQEDLEQGASNEREYATFVFLGFSYLIP